MGDEKVIKMVGLALSVVGMGLQIATGVLENKKLDLKIAKEVSKHLNK